MRNPSARSGILCSLFFFSFFLPGAPVHFCSRLGAGFISNRELCLFPRVPCLLFLFRIFAGRHDLSFSFQYGRYLVFVCLFCSVRGTDADVDVDVLLP
ncbi:hypothetical protein J3E69DRAFT_322170, partial [Trichoderma sp. SZMC 28015]